ncbi:hypothetical protein NL30_29005 [Burkholderia contaminans]|uniref:hypothetical protein n=1 Tax=Burkholderia contaminans TaxID=488447 RepID=UPI000649CE54|nr:hypothetical protein [Burkholderia contaminans]AKM43802.1 hypothetical protein NL30_29005 [Burkholderia contaminans]
MRRKFTNTRPVSETTTELVVLPAPRVNLHNLDAVRREMAKVYRDMRTNRIDSQDGARFVFVLSQIAKMFELCDLEQRIGRLEQRINVS